MENANDSDKPDSTLIRAKNESRIRVARVKETRVDTQRDGGVDRKEMGLDRTE